MAPPPGGPEDHTPPEILAISIDTNAVNVKATKIDVTFDEVIGERPVGVAVATPTGGSGAPSLEDVVQFSPRTGGAKVSWHRDRITIEPRQGFKPNTAYRLTLLPGIADIRGNVRKNAVSLTFSTGPTIPAFSIPGRLFDWEAGVPAPGGVIEASQVAGKDTMTWVAFTDSAGAFDVGPLGPGTYHVRGFIDTDHNQTLGVLEKWDTTSVTISNARSILELLAAQRDTASPGIQRVEVADSAYVRITLDKPYDPRAKLTTANVRIQRADSTALVIDTLLTDKQAQALRPKPDSGRDTTKSPIPRPRPDTVSTRPPAPKPSRPAPERVVVAHLAPNSRLTPGEKYVVTIRDIPNLLGHSSSSHFEFNAPKPQPAPTPKPPPSLTPKPPPEPKPSGPAPTPNPKPSS